MAGVARCTASDVRSSSAPIGVEIIGELGGDEVSDLRRSRALRRLAAAVVALLWLTPASVARAAPLLRVDYDPPRLSVEAQDVSLFAVLSEIGDQVGFRVVELSPSSTVVSVSIRDASLDEALRQLLRDENSTVLYQTAPGAMTQSAMTIEKIVLSGTPSATLAATDRASPVVASQRFSSPVGDPVMTPAPLATSGPLPGPGLVAVLPGDRGVVSNDSSDDSDVAATTVADLLKAHAMVAAGATRQASRTMGSSDAAPTVSLEASLAETTRRAQQAVAALVDGLATATRALEQSRAAAEK